MQFNLGVKQKKHFEGGFAISAIECSNVTTGQEFNHQGISFLGLPFEARLQTPFSWQLSLSHWKS